MGLMPIVALGIFVSALKFYPMGKEQVQALREKLDALHGE
jgi:Na+/melibiose symporter-like transporter